MDGQPAAFQAPETENRTLPITTGEAFRVIGFDTLLMLGIAIGVGVILGLVVNGLFEQPSNPGFIGMLVVLGLAETVLLRVFFKCLQDLTGGILVERVVIVRQLVIGRYSDLVNCDGDLQYEVPHRIAVGLEMDRLYRFRYFPRTERVAAAILEDKPDF